MASIKVWTTAMNMALCLVIVTSYPDGSPDSACISLTPDSHGPSTATGPSPYFIQTSSFTYTSNQNITVTLTGAFYKGYLIVARRTIGEDTDPVGYFYNPSSHSKLVCTSYQTGNGITQSNNTIVSRSTFQWTAPNIDVGMVSFHFTVIRGGAPGTKETANDYFTGQISSPLKPVTFEEQHEESHSMNVDENKNNLKVSSFEQILYRTNPHKEQSEESISINVDENRGSLKVLPFEQIIYRTHPRNV